MRLLALAGSGLLACYGAFLAVAMLGTHTPTALLPLPAAPTMSTPGGPPGTPSRARPTAVRPPATEAVVPGGPDGRPEAGAVPQDGVLIPSPAPPPAAGPVQPSTSTRLPPGRARTTDPKPGG